MEDALKYLPEFLITIITSLITFIVWAGRYQIGKIMRKLDVIHVDQQSMDYALERNLGNGYSADRDTKRVELLDKKKYVNRA